MFVSSLQGNHCPRVHLDDFKLVCELCFWIPGRISSLLRLPKYIFSKFALPLTRTFLPIIFGKFHVVFHFIFESVAYINYASFTQVFSNFEKIKYA